MSGAPAEMASLPLVAEAVGTVLFGLSMFAVNELRAELDAPSTWMPATSQLNVMSVEPTKRSSSAVMVTTTPICPGTIGPGVSTETVSIRGVCLAVGEPVGVTARPLEPTAMARSVFTSTAV